jgi:hypothetical protein
MQQRICFFQATPRASFTKKFFPRTLIDRCVLVAFDRADGGKVQPALEYQLFSAKLPLSRKRTHPCGQVDDAGRIHISLYQEIMYLIIRSESALHAWLGHPEQE